MTTTRKPATICRYCDSTEATPGSHFTEYPFAKPATEAPAWHQSAACVEGPDDPRGVYT